MKYLNISKCIIGIEANKPEAIAKMKAAIDVAGIEVKELPCRYPRALRRCSSRTAPAARFPSPACPPMWGVIVMNVTSAGLRGQVLWRPGMPLTASASPWTATSSRSPRTWRSSSALPIQELLDFCGGLTAEPGKMLYGGPMMGTCVASLDQPILKNNNAVLAFSQKFAHMPKATNCIHCGRCVSACPLGLAAKDIVQGL
ncbi:MAG: 4Fe-4S binding protein [Oscillospiraceae bacterium]